MHPGHFLLQTFSPTTALRHVQVGAEAQANSPEAHYQQEFYRCLMDITHGNVSVSLEFASGKEAKAAGRIDFFVPKVKWGSRSLEMENSWMTMISVFNRTGRMNTGCRKMTCRIIFFSTFARRFRKSNIQVSIYLSGFWLAPSILIFCQMSVISSPIARKSFVWTVVVATVHFKLSQTPYQSSTVCSY